SGVTADVSGRSNRNPKVSARCTALPQMPVRDDSQNSVKRTECRKPILGMFPFSNLSRDSGVRTFLKRILNRYFGKSTDAIEDGNEHHNIFEANRKIKE